MDKKKNSKELLKEELKRYKLISEYSFYVGEDDDYDKEADNLILGEDGDEENQEDPNNNNGPNNDANPDNTGNNGGDDNMGGEFDNPDDQSQPEQPIENPEPQVAPVPEPAPVDDEVEIDITQLVQSTESAKASADMATSKMEELLNKFTDLESRVTSMDSLTAKIDGLERQIEKRNPTPDERLEMRSFDSYPYNLKLSDYWAEKEGNYNVLNNNNEKKEKEYVLTKDDVDREYNESNINDTFEDYEEEDI